MLASSQERESTRAAAGSQAAGLGNQAGFKCPEQHRSEVGMGGEGRSSCQQLPAAASGSLASLTVMARSPHNYTSAQSHHAITQPHNHATAQPHNHTGDAGSTQVTPVGTSGKTQKA